GGGAASSHSATTGVKHASARVHARTFILYPFDRYKSGGGGALFLGKRARSGSRSARFPQRLFAGFPVIGMIALGDRIQPV
ncbi:MAG: hypothetical protein ABSG18_22265, partial [Steroidobacteraceae bacterium]